MNLDAKDVEAIGKSRANRSLSQNIKYLLYGGSIVCFGGAIYWIMGGGTVGLGIAFVGMVGVLVGSHLADKWRKVIVTQLKREWRAELESRQ